MKHTIKTIRTERAIKQYRYRVGISYCPKCRWMPRDDLVWLKPHNISHVCFDPPGVWRKPGKVLLFTPCLKCLTISFHHWSLERLAESWGGWPKYIIKQAKAELKRRKKEATPCPR